MTANDVKAPPAPGAPDAPPTKQSAFGTVKGALALFGGVVVISQAIIASVGWTTPVTVFLGVAAAGVGAAGTYLVANKTALEKVGLAWFIVAFVAIALIVLLAYLLNEHANTYAGEITKEHPSDEQSFSAGNGEYEVVLTSTDRLKAHLRLSHGIFDFSGTSLEDGRVVVRDILTDGTWKATVTGLDGSTGHYEFRVNSDAADPLRIGDSMDDESLGDPTYSNSYVLHVPKREKVYLRVTPQSPSDPPLDVQVLKTNGFAAANPQRDGSNIVIFHTFAPGDYLVEVKSVSHEVGDYALVVSRKAPSGTASDVTVPVGSPVPVPNVVGLRREAALQALSRAGFVPRAFDVCSASVDRGIVGQVAAVGNGDDVPVVNLDGVTPAGQKLAAGTNLIVKTGTGEPCT